MIDQAMTDSPQRSRGRGFPTLPLGEARDYINEVAKYGSSHNLNAFAQHLGHQKPSGGAFNHKIAAIRDFGLVQRSGQTVQLTALALRLAMPTSPEQELQDLREAFFTSDAFAEAYERNAKGTPLAIEGFANAAALNIGVAGTAREKFTRSFIRSAVTAGLAEELSASSFRLLPKDARSAAAEPGQAASAPEATTSQPSASDESMVSAPLPAALRPRFKQTWQFDGGQLDISIALDGPFPRDAYAVIGTSMAELIGILEDSSIQERE